MENFAPLPPHIMARLEKLPPTPSIPQIAEFLDSKLPTVRQQIRRGTFPITVRQIGEGHQYVLLSDVYRFCIDGIPQPQIERQIRPARNPSGRYGKDGKPIAANAPIQPIQRGRKTNRQKSAEAAAAGGAAC